MRGQGLSYNTGIGAGVLGICRINKKDYAAACGVCAAEKSAEDRRGLASAGAGGSLCQPHFRSEMQSLICSTAHFRYACSFCRACPCLF